MLIAVTDNSLVLTKCVQRPELLLTAQRGAVTQLGNSFRWVSRGPRVFAAARLLLEAPGEAMESASLSYSHWFRALRSLRPGGTTSHFYPHDCGRWLSTTIPKASNRWECHRSKPADQRGGATLESQVEEINYQLEKSWLPSAATWKPEM
ncbi:hypothetical protein NDU88_008565 [Pleurodeles waltl]|uniref:Uncharacterized protein n=1 Tax=Pleurodeles waltl TaxID=8319 RepID=A0AAV7QQ27_PLEWA|nr:hypothetical protein NDU88_008565 [Pleurodeles waltl]